MKKIAIAIIKFYMKFISPLFPPRCRFYPTCSAYSLECFKRFGFIKGLYLSIKRILKCNPFNKGGIDKVPESFNFF
ncbi:MAG: membrane protein insertion efficiency factor YidD [Oscillospiraceae bacterium]